MPVSGAVNLFRDVYSCLLTAGAVVLVIWGIAKGHASLPGPPPLHLVILFSVIILLAYLEGLQVAILALENESNEGFKQSHPRAYKLHAMVTREQNVQRFLIGRQFFVVFVVFLIAQLTTFRDLDLGLAEWLHVAIIDTGFAGALFTLCFGQLIPQLVASTHPLLMMGIPGAYEVTSLCVVLEWLGVCQASWVLKRLFVSDEHQDRQCDARDIENHQPKTSTRAVHYPMVTEVSTNESSTSFDSSDRSSTATSPPKAESTKALDTKGADISAHKREESWKVVDPVSEWRQDDKGTWTRGVSIGGNMGFKSERAPHELASLEPFNGFPSPSELAASLKASGRQVPRYLLPPNDPLHVPPHVIAYEMLRMKDPNAIGYPVMGQAADPASMGQAADPAGNSSSKACVKGFVTEKEEQQEKGEKKQEGEEGEGEEGGERVTSVPARGVFD